MPTTITKLFKHVGLAINGQVKWGELINSRACGFYVVALTNDSEKLTCSNKPLFNDNAIQQWIERVNSGGKQIQLDYKIADLTSIKERLGHFWFPDETIIYIGKAGPNKKRTIRKRVNEYYKTLLGCDKPHAGGHWINTLQNVSSFNIFYAEYSGLDIDEKEEQLISYFMDNISDETKEILFDKTNCFPFANKELYRKSLKTKIRKEHGLNNQTVECDKI
ncbi:MAG: hypothetical protein ACOYMA_06475 [Bacteroidia bacterium]